MYVKARCKECEPPILVFGLWDAAGGEKEREMDEDKDKEGGGEWGAWGKGDGMEW